MASTRTRSEPLLLEPTLSRRLWGGTRLGSLAGIDVGDDPTPVGELWTAYGGNTVLSGRHAGRPLAEVATAEGERLLGTAAVARYGARMPLLAKFIDAAAPLSIQVHPDDSYATTVEVASGHLGKGEAWYVLAADAGAHIVWGWHRDVTQRQVREAVEAGRLEPLLNRVAVAAGDIVYNPPGLVHAVGGGILLYEIQQDSDLTYRLYDYGRRGEDGNLRELHVEKALAVADLRRQRAQPQRGARAGPAWAPLLTTPYFVLESVALAGMIDQVGTPHSLAIVTVARGRAVLRWDGGALTAESGRSLVVPAELPNYRLEGQASLFRSSLPRLGSG